MKCKMPAGLGVWVLLFLLMDGMAAARADTLVFVPQNNNYWPDPNNWFTNDSNTQMLVHVGRAPIAGDSAIISANVVVNLTALSLNLNTLTLDTDAWVTNGLVTASTVVMYAGSGGAQTILQNVLLSVLTEFDVLGGNCALYSSTLTLKPGAVAVLGALGVPGQLSFSASTIDNYGQISLTTSGSYLTGGTSLVNETNAVIDASTNATLSGAACVFDNSGLVRCEGGTFSVGQFASWTSQSGQALFETTSSNAAIKFPSGLTVPAGATNYFYGPGTNYWVEAVIQGTAQLGYLDPVTLLFTNGNVFFSVALDGAGTVHAATMQGMGSVLTWYNATVGGPTLNIDPLSQLNVTDPFAHDLTAGTINNSGAFTWSNGATFSIESGATLNNLAGGTFYCLITNTSIDGSITGSGVLNNAGTFRKAAGVNGIVFAPSGSGPAFNNSGLLQVLSGYVQLSGGAYSGSFDLSGGELWFGYNSNILNAGAQFTGTNFVREVGPGTMFVNTNISLANFELRNSTGVLDGPGNLTVSNDCLISSGTIQGAGSLTIPLGAALNVNGFAFWSQRTLNNSGTTTLAGAGGIATQGGGLFNNLAGGVFNIQNNNGIALSSGAPGTFNNFGLFEKSAGTGSSSFSIYFTNDATVQIQSGTVYLSPNYEQLAGATTIASNSILEVGVLAMFSGGTLSGVGTVSGTLSNAATVAPGPLGSLTVQGNYDQGVQGSLSIVLGGGTAGQFSRLSVNGEANLAGVLEVALTNGFTPAVGDVFAVISASGGIFGGFSTVAGSHAGNGVTLVSEATSSMFDLLAANDLVLSAAAYTGHQFSFSYPSTAGLTNIIEYTTSLSPAHWLVLTNITGDGSLKSVQDPSATNSDRFYRVLFP
jgi:hypothetical protein